VVTCGPRDVAIGSLAECAAGGRSNADVVTIENQGSEQVLRINFPD